MRIIVISMLLFISLIATPQRVFSKYKNLRQNLAIIDFENRTTLKDIGEGVQDILITGRVINFGLVHASCNKDYFVVGLEAHLVSTKTGETLSVNEANVHSKHEINIGDLRKMDFQSEAFMSTLIGEATRKGVDMLISEMKNTMVSYPWEGSVIKLDGNTVYVSGGKKVGLGLGDRLVVLKETERIEDPATGAQLKRRLGLVGEIEVTQLK